MVMYPAMGEDRTAPKHGQGQPERLLTVSAAAEELGISAEAVRSRVKRGTLGSVKEKSTVYVLLPERPGDDQTTTEHDQTSAQTGARGTAQEELVESLIDQLAYMREQLAEEREARRRADTIIAQLTHANATLANRVPELEASTEQREAHVTASEEADKGTAPPEQQEPSQRRERSWWRAFLGLE
jgi:DNA-binding Lrp family transcriptional regulator